MSLVVGIAASLRTRHSSDLAQQLHLQDEFALLVFLAVLIRLVVLPSHHLFTLPTTDVAHDVLARGHVTFHLLACDDVDNAIEEVGLAMLTAEILQVARADQPNVRIESA